MCCADFNYYINRQGIQGRKGEKGDKGFSPTINVSTDTVDEYKLIIANEDNTFETPNLRGNINVLDNGGTYLRYDKETQQISAQDMDAATANTLGGVRLSTEENITAMSADTVVTPADVADALPVYLQGEGAVTITQDEATSKTKINVDLSSVNELTTRVSNAEAEIVGIQADVADLNTDVSALKDITTSHTTSISAINDNIANLNANKVSKTDFATTETAGIVKVDGTTIIADENGVISSVNTGTGDVTAAGNNRFTGDNTFIGKVNIAGGALTVDGVANLNQTTAQFLNAVNITSPGEINATSIKANGLRSDDIQTTENKKYLTELDVDNQTIQVVNGKLHANLDELGNEVNNLTGRVTATEADITTLQTNVTDLTGAVENKQNKLVSGNNITLTDNADGTTTIAATGGGETYPVEVRNFKVNGTLTNDNEVYSGFSTSNYISVDNSIMKLISKDGNTAIETNIGFVTGSDFNEDYAILCNTATGASLGSLHITKDGKLAYWDGYTLYKVNKALEFNKKYIAKMITYKSRDSRNAVYVIEDNGYTLDTLPDISQWVGITGSFRLVDTSTYLLGKNNVNQYLNGKIDINLCNQKANGEETWRAVFKDNYPAPLATTEHVGLVKPDGTTITIDQYGTISADVPTPTNMVTTNTAQTINASKRFYEGLTLGNPNGFRGYLSAGVLSLGDGGGANLYLKADTKAPKINFHGNLVIEAQISGSSITLNSWGSNLKVAEDTLEFTKRDGTVVDLLNQSGGGAIIDDTTASTTTTYSSSKIEALIGNISTILDNINGEVI